MKIKIFLLGSLLFLLSFGQTEAADPTQSSQTDSCFSFYRFGSVELSFEPDKLEYTSGDEVTFSGTIKNQNDYPVVNGGLYTLIYRKVEGNGYDYLQGNDVVDQFYGLKDVTLDANQAKKFKIKWTIPKDQSAGQYEIRGNFNVNDSYNLAGLPFYESIYSGKAEFTVQSSVSANVYIDKDSVTINGEKYGFRAPSLKLDGKNQTAKVEYDLLNPTGSSQSIDLNNQLYWWDTANEKNLLKQENKTVQLAAGQRQRISYEFPDQEYSVYDLKIIAKPQGGQAKNIIELRTSPRNGSKNARINFPGVTKFPIKKGETVTLFTCAHATGAFTLEKGKIQVELVDENNQVVKTLEYQGSITGEMMGQKLEFVAPKDIDRMSLRAVLYDQDQLKESATLVYDCTQINPEKCLNPGSLALAKKDGNNNQKTQNLDNSSDKKTPAKKANPEVIGILAFLGLLACGLLSWALLKKRMR